MYIVICIELPSAMYCWALSFSVFFCRIRLLPSVLDAVALCIVPIRSFPCILRRLYFGCCLFLVVELRQLILRTSVACPADGEDSPVSAHLPEDPDLEKRLWGMYSSRCVHAWLHGEKGHKGVVVSVGDVLFHSLCRPSTTKHQSDLASEVLGMLICDGWCSILCCALCLIVCMPGR